MFPSGGQYCPSTRYCPGLSSRVCSPEPKASGTHTTHKRIRGCRGGCLGEGEKEGEGKEELEGGGGVGERAGTKLVKPQVDTWSRDVWEEGGEPVRNRTRFPGVGGGGGGRERETERERKRERVGGGWGLEVNCVLPCQKASFGGKGEGKGRGKG